MSLKDISEFSPQELEQWSCLEQQLQTCGWQHPAGLLVQDEPTMEYVNQHLSLSLSYAALEQALLFSLEKANGTGLTLEIFFEDKGRSLLETIISFQDKIAPANFREYIQLILQQCPRINALLGLERDKSVPLTDGTIVRLEQLGGELPSPDPPTETSDAPV